jgi:hypothetical protein
MYGAVMVSLGTGSREQPYLYGQARRWGLELSTDYFELAGRRIQAVADQPK